MRSFYEGSALDAFNFAVHHPLSNIFLRIFLFWLFYLGPMLTLPFLMLLLALPFEAKLSDFSAPKQFLLLLPAPHSREWRCQPFSCSITLRRLLPWSTRLFCGR